MAIGEAEAAFAKTIAANQVSIAAFLALPCITDGGKGYVTNLQSGTTKAQTDAESEYKSYMAFVTKPMLGSGKCDGGFQGVATESARRKERTAQAMQKIFQIETSYNTQAVSNLFTPVIIYSGVGGEGCMDTASALFDTLEAQTSTVQNSMGQVLQSLQYEAAKFGDFEAQNNVLRAHCGESSPDPANMVNASTGQGQRAPASAGVSGNSSNPASSITGIQQDEDQQAEVPGASP